MARKKKKSAPPADGPLSQGRVTRSLGASSRVETEQGEVYECIVRGRFRIEGLRSTNPVAVGDEVRFMLPSQEGEPGVITEVLPRKNYLLRQAISQTHKVHILAANVDAAILLYTLKEPATAPGFADRFLVVAEAYHIPVYILINKVDLLEGPDDQAQLAEITNTYRKAGYPVHPISAHRAEDRALVIALLQDKISFIGGHSGAGKSTLINLVDPSLDLKTREISDASGKGRHTTTYAEMHALAPGGYIIDSPGIKELGITGFDTSDLSHYYPEMRDRLHDCRFSNCTHRAEPGCAIKAAVAAGEIGGTRYASYLRMMEELEQR
ncbi:MAG: ribosome small subunit-dependent GTPase A [Bacteroidetes bacterium]|nr:MAG: ribosome small subunit-dependent GTPase A [Bacteroidota bacterium]